jgi:hypothetical protein
VQFGCTFHRRMRFRCHFQWRKLKIDIENACDGETHIQTAHPKRKCNRHESPNNCLVNSVPGKSCASGHRIRGPCPILPSVTWQPTIPYPFRLTASKSSARRPPSRSEVCPTPIATRFVWLESLSSNCPFLTITERRVEIVK